MSNTQTIDLERELDQGQWNGYAKLVMVLAAFAIGMDGLATQTLPLAIPALMKDWHLARGAFALANASGLVGISVGAAIAGILGDRFGRRVALLGSLLLFGLMTAGSASFTGVPSLCVMRALAGLGLGGAVPNATCLIAEVTPLRLRSRAITIGITFMPLGGMLAGLLAGPVLARWDWRGLFVLSGVVCLVTGAVLAAFLPESPRFLLRHPRQRNALLKMVTRMGHRYPAETRFADSVENQRRVPWYVILTADRRHDTYSLWVAFFFALLALYSIFNWAPAMLSAEGFRFDTIGLAMSGFGVAGIVGGFGSTWLMERIGSKRALLFVCGLCITASLLISHSPLTFERGSRIAIAGLSLQGMFLAAVQNMLYAVAAYVYPAENRGAGVGMALSIGRMGAVASAFTGTLALSFGGMHFFFLTLAVAIAVTTVAIMMLKRHIPLIKPELAAMSVGTMPTAP